MSAAASTNPYKPTEHSYTRAAQGVTLTDHQEKLVGSVLELFRGRPSEDKLALWADDATFEDPMAKAEGRKQYSAQWYALPNIVSEIERLHYEVTSSANPITMDFKQRYILKGIQVPTTITSVVYIYTSPDGKITKVQDKWNGELPSSAFTEALRKASATVTAAVTSTPATSS